MCVRARVYVRACMRARVFSSHVCVYCCCCLDDGVISFV